MSSTELYLRLLRYVVPYRGVFGLAILGTIVVALTEPVLPAIMKPLFDGAFVERDPVVIRWIPIALIALMVVRGLAEYASSYCIAWVSNRLVMDLRKLMFARLLELPASYYDDQASGNLISKITYDVTQVTSAATNVITIILKDTLTIIGLLGWMLYLNWKLTLISLVMTPLIVVVVRVVGIRLRNSSRGVQEAMGDLTQVAQEAIEGHKVVKLYGGQAYETSRFDEQAGRVRRHLMKLAGSSAASVPIVQLIAAFALAFMVYLATHQTGGTAVSVGEFTSFITAMLMLTAPLKRLTNVNDPLQRGLAAAESVFALVDQPGEADPGKGEIARARGDLRFENISFLYQAGGATVLHDISLNIAPGETVALVGSSGSGKTTLANLVPGFHRPSSGRITLDGVDIATLKLASLRSNIALVSQDVVLFNDTVAANIAYGAMNGVSESEITAAADAAHATEFIRDMPEGFKTMVGENGVKLSGGQRQRIAIARALLRNAPVLILDEATSALDTESERHVQVALEALMRNRTTLVIAHRLSTIENADRIVVLDQGRIAEIGAHAELLARGGIYAKLHSIQFVSDGHTAKL